jgi:hypothetical protein
LNLPARLLIGSYRSYRRALNRGTAEQIHGGIAFSVAWWMTLFALLTWWRLQGHPSASDFSTDVVLRAAWAVSVALAAATAATLALNQVVAVDRRDSVFYIAQAVLGYITGLSAFSQVTEAQKAGTVLIVSTLVLFNGRLALVWSSFADTGANGYDAGEGPPSPRACSSAPDRATLLTLPPLDSTHRALSCSASSSVSLSKPKRPK